MPGSSEDWSNLRAAFEQVLLSSNDDPRFILERLVRSAISANVSKETIREALMVIVEYDPVPVYEVVDRLDWGEYDEA